MSSLLRGVLVSVAFIALNALAILPVQSAPVEDVLGACDKMADQDGSCGYSISGNGDISGCTQSACFYCPADGSRECIGITQRRQQQLSPRLPRGEGLQIK
jgi:hypothetical protein